MSIYEVPDCNGKVHTGLLPSGDVTVWGSGDQPAIDLARTIARRHDGEWNEPHGNWIVPRRNSRAVANDCANETLPPGRLNRTGK